jgi:amino acid adenylation domain-containing protein
MNRYDSDRLAVAAAQNVKERDYWLKKLAGPWTPTSFPYDFSGSETGTGAGIAETDFTCTGPLFSKLMKLCGGLDIKLHMVLTAGLMILLHRCTAAHDILVGSPALKQEPDIDYINTLLVFRTQVAGDMSFKDFLLRVRTTIVEAAAHQNYPLGILAERLGRAPRDRESAFFDVALLLENIHDPAYLHGVHCSLLFSFTRTDRRLTGRLAYDTGRYRRDTVTAIAHRYRRVLDQVLDDIHAPLSRVELLTPAEREHLLHGLNDTDTAYPQDRLLHQLWQDQVQRAPQRIALVAPALYGDVQHLSYQGLNEEANRLAHFLRSRGVGPNTVVGLLLPRGLEMMAALWGTLKSGGAYLPIDTDTPSSRAAAMLTDTGASILLTHSRCVTGRSFTELQGLATVGTPPTKTAPRPRITDLDSLPLVDRSVIDYNRYNRFIGYAGVKHTISLEATRGCPYHCTYCHKIFPDRQVSRSAEHIFDEVQYFYRLGVRRFSVIDDIFNLDIKNSSCFFDLIRRHGLKPHLFFSAGLRGDILTEEYIDRMVEAGTVSMSPALETASPRLQKWIGKNLNIEKFRRNIEYICKNYPQVILELFIMHGFPGETEEEARLTLDFVKRLKWVHFPYINILRIYSATKMARMAVEKGIPYGAIIRSEDLAWHELPETLPFARSFTLKYQTEFLNDYFLDRERLRHVLPHQMRLMTEDELVEKYDSYLPVKIEDFPHLLEFLKIEPAELGGAEFLSPQAAAVPDLNEKLRRTSPPGQPDTAALRVLLLDLNLYFSGEDNMLYDLVDEPLGLMKLLTQLKQAFGSRIQGRIAKSRLDFDDYDALRSLVETFKPAVIGIRSLTFYRDFFHRTVSLLRQWGIEVPIIMGGPHVTTNSAEVLQDPHIDVAVLGEGEITFVELMTKIVEGGGALPTDEVLATIPGIAFIPRRQKLKAAMAREIVMLDAADGLLSAQPRTDPAAVNRGRDLAYVIFTSGTSGRPKGVAVSHGNVLANLFAFYREFAVKPRDTVIQLASYAFDVFVEEVFPLLLRGGKVVMAAEHDIMDIRHLEERLIARHHVNIIDCTPLLLNEFNRQTHLEGIDLFISGGDELKKSQVDRLVHIGTVYNTYGPTETTVCATYHRVSAQDDPAIPIGKAIANYRVYILDRYHHLLPPGLAGEICIAGPGVTPGYLNRPELTSEKFVNAAAKSHEGTRSSPHKPLNPKSQILYRTGDLGRLRPDNSLEFLGRIDHQVKIRGYRIEPAEIDSLLHSRRDVEEAVVVCRTDSTGEKYLCAYVVLRQSPSPTAADPPEEAAKVAELKAFLARTLPDYMVPPFVVFLERLPLTANGKLDSLALPEPQVRTGGQYAAPRDRVERDLTRLWAVVLGVDQPRLGIDADFFNLGGNSLKAIHLIDRIHKDLDVRVGLTDVFKISTIRELAAHIKAESAKNRDPYAGIEAAESADYYPLSPAQKRLYILQQMEPQQTVYNMPFMMKLQGEPEMARLQGAFADLIARHQSLRTAFVLVAGEPVQRVKKQVDFKIDWLDAGGTDIQDMIREFIRPFDLARPPLLRVKMAAIKDNEYLLMVDMHHIVGDGISHTIFSEDLLHLYRQDPLPRLRLQYKDYACWQARPGQSRQQERARQEAFWLQQFQRQPPILNLPLDFPRPPVQSFEGQAHGFAIAPDQARGLRNLARDAGATLHMVLLTIFDLLLGRLTGQADVVVGVPVAGRRHADLQRIIGVFINTLAIRTFPQADKPFLSFLQEVRQTSLTAFENQEYPFEDLVERAAVRRDVSRNPLFDVIFMFQDAGNSGPLKIPGLRLETLEYEGTTAKFDLSLSCLDSGAGIRVVVEYGSRLFQAATIRRWAAYFGRIVAAVLADAGQTLGDIDTIPAEEKRLVLEDFNRTAAAYPGRRTLHGLFVRQAQKTPRRIALDEPASASHLAYAALHDVSDRLARRLLAGGSGPGTIVAFRAEPGLDMVVQVMAILKAGAAYLPIDPGYPQERVRGLLTDSGARLWQPEAVHRQAAAPASGRLPETDPRDAAYVIYTSGSTGRPKGVPVSHASAVNLVWALQQHYPLSPVGAYLLKTSVVFDVSVTELFHWFLPGSRLVVMPGPGQRDPAMIVDTVEKAGVSHLNFVPSMFNVFLDYVNRDNIDRLSSLQYIFLAGEALLPQLVEKFRRLNTPITLENLYGPTEATVYASGYSLKNWPGQGPVPIGRALPNVNLYILDNCGHTQGLGLAGELCIAGRGVARGYLNNPELTADKFINAAAKSREGTRSPQNKTLTPKSYILYRTGDLCRWLPDGQLEFLGRLDRQVKVRGFRIEPAEVESLLLKHPHIKEAVVLAAETTPGENHLTAYIVPQISRTNETSRTSETSPAKLRQYLAESLPDFMVPSRFVVLNRIPLTPSGKLDRSVLDTQGTPLESGAQHIAPSGSSEKIIADIWTEMLNLDRVGVTENIFDLGGTSIDLIRINVRLKEVFKRNIPMVNMFRYPNIRAFARYLSQQEGDGSPLTRDHLPQQLARGKQSKIQSLRQRRGSRHE